jgi:hypothetical protein
LIFFILSGNILTGADSDTDSGDDEYAEEISHQWGKTDGFGIIFFFGITPSLLNIKPYQEAGYINIEKPMGNSFDLSFKYKTIFLYFRSGIGYTFKSPLSLSGSSGKSFTNSPNEYSAQYLKVPVVAGINFFIQDQGSVQIGLGGVYLNGEQSYIYKDKSKNVTIKGSTFGLMFQLSGEMNITSNLLVTSEINIFQTRSNAIQLGDSPNKTRELDYGGMEFLLGLGYYFYH